MCGRIAGPKFCDSLATSFFSNAGVKDFNCAIIDLVAMISRHCDQREFYRADAARTELAGKANVTAIMCHSERSEESLTASTNCRWNTEMFRFAQHGDAIMNGL